MLHKMSKDLEKVINILIGETRKTTAIETAKQGPIFRPTMCCVSSSKSKWNRLKIMLQISESINRNGSIHGWYLNGKRCGCFKNGDKEFLEGWKQKKRWHLELKRQNKWYWKQWKKKK